MKLLQGTILSLLLFSLCCRTKGSDMTIMPLSSTISATTNTSVLTTSTESSQNPVIQSTAGTSPEGTTKTETLKSSSLTTSSSLTATVKDKGNTIHGVMKNELRTTNSTVTNSSLPNATSTLPSSQHTTDTSQPDTPPSKTTTLPSVSMSENILQSPGFENGKDESSSSTSPSYSSIILPVVIALIVITLSVFVLVGLYRMCQKTDPGTPENGNDQPQSDKESVKLLTVKTISHEPGEHSAQGKTKN
ncbi:endomucin [Dugong dugon]